MASGATSARCAPTWSAPCPTTTTVRSARSGAAAASTWPSRVRPSSGCSTLGRADFIRLPSPAASTTTVRRWGSDTTWLPSGRRQSRGHANHATRGSSHGRTSAVSTGLRQSWRRQDSNQELKTPKACGVANYTTPHRPCQTCSPSNQASMIVHDPEQLGDQTLDLPVAAHGSRHGDHQAPVVVVAGVAADGGGVVPLQRRRRTARPEGRASPPTSARPRRVGRLVDADPVARHVSARSRTSEEAEEQSEQSWVAVDELEAVLLAPRLRLGALAPVDRRPEQQQVPLVERADSRRARARSASRRRIARLPVSGPTGRRSWLRPSPPACRRGVVRIERQVPAPTGTPSTWPTLEPLRDVVDRAVPRPAARTASARSSSFARGRRVHSGGGTPRSSAYTRSRPMPRRAWMSRTESCSTTRSRRASAASGSVTYPHVRTGVRQELHPTIGTLPDDLAGPWLR